MKKLLMLLFFITNISYAENIITPQFDSKLSELTLPLVRFDNQPGLDFEAVLQFDFENKTFKVLKFNNLYCRFGPEKEICKVAQ